MALTSPGFLHATANHGDEKNKASRQETQLCKQAILVDGMPLKDYEYHTGGFSTAVIGGSDHMP